MKKMVLSVAAAAAFMLSSAGIAGATPTGLGAVGDSASTSQSTQIHWRSYRHNHWNRGHHRGWGYGRRCWRSCTGVGPVRVCKRKCRW